MIAPMSRFWCNIPKRNEGKALRKM
jgi:hypothetical protein